MAGLPEGNQVNDTTEQKKKATMKLKPLQVAAVCAECAVFRHTMTQQDMMMLFERFRKAVETPLDRESAAEILACHSVSQELHAFHAALLHWVSLPECESAELLARLDAPQRARADGKSRKVGEVWNCDTSLNTSAAAPARTARGAGPRRQTGSEAVDQQ